MSTNLIGKLFKGTDRQGKTYIARCTEIRGHKIIINFFDDNNKQVFDIIPESIKEIQEKQGDK